MAQEEAMDRAQADITRITIEGDRDTLIRQLRGRARFLRDKGRVKDPELLERAADEIECGELLTGRG